MKLKKLAFGLIFSVFALAAIPSANAWQLLWDDEVKVAREAELKAARLEGAAGVKDQLMAKTEEAAKAKADLADKAKKDAAAETRWARNVVAKAKKAEARANYKPAVMKASKAAPAKNAKKAKAKKSRA